MKKKRFNKLYNDLATCAKYNKNTFGSETIGYGIISKEQNDISQNTGNYVTIYNPFIYIRKNPDYENGKIEIRLTNAIVQGVSFIDNFTIVHTTSNCFVVKVETSTDLSGYLCQINYYFYLES